MEALAIIGLAGNILQFVDFSTKLISKSNELYKSAEGALADHHDIEATTDDLVLMNQKVMNGASSSSDNSLKALCESCNRVAGELLTALEKLKVKGRATKWLSIRKALRSLWSKEKLDDLERRLGRLRNELVLHIAGDLSCVFPPISLSKD